MWVLIVGGSCWKKVRRVVGYFVVGFICGGVGWKMVRSGEGFVPGFALHVGEGRRVNGLC